MFLLTSNLLPMSAIRESGNKAPQYLIQGMNVMAATLKKWSTRGEVSLIKTTNKQTNKQTKKQTVSGHTVESPK